MVYSVTNKIWVKSRRFRRVTQKKIKNIERHPCNKFIPEVKTFLASYLFVVSGLAVALGYSGEIKKIDAPTPTSKLSAQDAEGKKFTCKR